MLKCPRIVHDSAIEGLLMDVRVIESIREQPARSCLDFTMTGHLSHETSRSACCHKNSSNYDNNCLPAHFQVSQTGQPGSFDAGQDAHPDRTQYGAVAATGKWLSKFNEPISASSLGLKILQTILAQKR